MDILKFFTAFYHKNIKANEAYEIIGQIAVNTAVKGVPFSKKFKGTLGPGKRAVSVSFTPETGFDFNDVKESRKVDIMSILTEADKLDFILPPEAMNNPDSVNFKSIMAQRRREHEEQKAKEAEIARRAELQQKYSGVLQKVEAAESTDDKISVLFNELVPSSGASDTIAGELIRAINRLMYRDYNDGDRFYEGYGLETCASAAAYLGDHGFDKIIDEIMDNSWRDDDDYYTSKLEELGAQIIDEIINNPELLETPLDYDMWDANIDDIIENQPRYEFEYDIDDIVQEYMEAGLINIWDVHQVVEGWLEYQNAFEGAEVSRPFGHYDSSVTIENLTRAGLDEIENWNRWDMWEEYKAELRAEYGSLEDDEDDDEDEYTEDEE